jgi:hypothetical protein
METAPQHLRTYLRDEFESILDRDEFEEGLYAHLTGGYGAIDANHIKNRLIESFDIHREKFRGHSR